MRYVGPKNRIARREGTDLGLKTPGSKSHARLLKRLNILPGQHGAKGRRKVSEHASQLREKQKMRYMFGVNEKQLKRYFQRSVRKKGNTAFFLAQQLEGRLDTIVFRLGFSPTRASARQLIGHGHIKVNDKIVTIPSYQVRVDDIISFSSEAPTKIGYVEKSLLNKDMVLPKWLERKGSIGKLISEPTSEEIEKQITLRSIIEFYSR